MEITIQYPCQTRNDYQHNAIVALNPQTGASIKTVINPCGAHIRWLNNLSPCDQFVRNPQNLLQTLIHNIQYGIIKPQGNTLHAQIQWTDTFFKSLFHLTPATDPFDSPKPEDALSSIYEFFLEQSKRAANRFIRWIWETYPLWKDSYWAATIFEWHFPIQATPDDFRRIIKTILRYHQHHNIPFRCYATTELLSALTTRGIAKHAQHELYTLAERIAQEIKSDHQHDTRTHLLVGLLEQWHMPHFTDIVNYLLETGGAETPCNP